MFPRSHSCKWWSWYSNQHSWSVNGYTFSCFSICHYCWSLIKHKYPHQISAIIYIPHFFLKSQLESVHTVWILASIYLIDHSYYTFSPFLASLHLFVSSTVISIIHTYTMLTSLLMCILSLSHLLYRQQEIFYRKYGSQLKLKINFL